MAQIRVCQYLKTSLIIEIQMVFLTLFCFHPNSGPAVSLFKKSYFELMKGAYALVASYARKPTRSGDIRTTLYLCTRTARRHLKQRPMLHLTSPLILRVKSVTHSAVLTRLDGIVTIFVYYRQQTVICFKLQN